MAKNWRKATQREVKGTGARGYLNTSYSNIRGKLGKPIRRGEGFKVDVEWMLMFDDKTVVTIYNYKDGKNYLGEKGKAVSIIRDWHVGGKGDVMKHLKELFPRAKKESS